MLNANVFDTRNVFSQIKLDKVFRYFKINTRCVNIEKFILQIYMYSSQRSASA
jgi:hypothetical protein